MSEKSGPIRRREAIIGDTLEQESAAIDSRIVVEYPDGETMTVLLREKRSDDELAEDATVISLDSPIGKALNGHRNGETVTVKTPSGTVELKIISLENAA